jgi:hypothetical protein
MTSEKGQLEQVGETPLQAYTAPILTCYGSLSDLTRGGTFVGNDGNTNCTGQASTADPEDCGFS